MFGQQPLSIEESSYAFFYNRGGKKIDDCSLKLHAEWKTQEMSSREFSKDRTLFMDLKNGTNPNVVLLFKLGMGNCISCTQGANRKVKIVFENPIANPHFRLTQSIREGILLEDISGNSYARISFDIIKEGTGDLEIPFTVKSTSDKKNDIDGVGIIVFHYTIKNLYQEKPKPDLPLPLVDTKVTKPQEMPDPGVLSCENNKHGGLKVWLKHLRDFSECKEEFESFVNAEDERMWKSCRSQKSPKNCYLSYIETFEFTGYGKHLAEAKRLANPPVPTDPEILDWNETRRVNTLEGYKKFTEKYPNGKNIVNAQEEVKRLSPMLLFREQNGNGDDYTFHILNAKNPQFKDITIGGRLRDEDIDITRIGIDTTLRIRFSGDADYRVLIQDQWGKKDTIVFNNLMSVQLDSIGMKKYQIMISKGKMPYKIEFIASNKNYIVNVTEGNTYEFALNDLMNQGLGGEIAIEVIDAEESRVGIKKRLFVKNNNYMKFLGIGLGGVVLLSILILLLKRRSQNKAKNRIVIRR